VSRLVVAAGVELEDDPRPSSVATDQASIVFRVPARWYENQLLDRQRRVDRGHQLRIRWDSVRLARVCDAAPEGLAIAR
jgi:hypothetical protein